MFDHLSFGKRVAAGFSLVTVLTIAVGLGAIVALESVSSTKDRVLEVESKNMIRIEALRATIERKSGALRGYLLTRDDQALAVDDTRAEIDQLLAELHQATVDPEGQRLLQEVRRLEREHQQTFDKVARELSDAVAAGRAFSDAIQPVMRELRTVTQTFRDRQEVLLTAGLKNADAEVASTETLLIAIVALALILAIAAAIILTRVISKQIGQAITRVHSSAAELQTAASQQASSTKEQSTAMSEITTTINELLVTSRQIAESAQRVAQIADGTARSTRGGQDAMGKSAESMATIKRQVDLIVHQMLDLGRKSQHIGGILDIINELAEQTNILSINATIEAAGAGEHGRRFAVVADEIRRLADRVAGSTREIRGLIEEVRSAVNTAVMTTEGGTKAVDAGVRQFDDVTGALREIVQSAGTTTEAAREIELSTKQQATAVSQVNVAIASVAQATREAEASATQTYQTAAELSALARDLTRLIWARDGARPNGQGAAT